MIVGSGFAGLGCALELAKHDHVHTTLLDKNNYHQFQPLLYQVATSLLAPSDIAHSLRAVFADQDNVDVKLAEISAVDTTAKTVRSTDGEEWAADALVLAAGSQPNFFHHPRRRRALVPAVLARECDQPAIADPRPLRAGRPGPEAGQAGCLELRDRRRRPHRCRGGRRPRRHARRDRAGRVRRPRYGRGAHLPARLRRRAAQALLRQGPRLRGQGADGAKGRAPARHRGQGDRTRPRKVLGWGGHGHPLRHLGRWHHRAPRRRRRRPPAGTRRAGRRAARPDARRQPRGLRGRRHRQHSRPGPQAASPARVRGAADRPDRREQYPRRFRGRVTSAVRLPRQGHHGDDRAPRGDRGGRQEPPRDTRRAGTHGVARSSRDPDDRGASQGRGDARLGVDRFSKTGGPHVLDRGEAADIDWEDDPAVPSSGATATPPDEQEPTKTAP